MAALEEFIDEHGVAGLRYQHPPHPFPSTWQEFLAFEVCDAGLPQIHTRPGDLPDLYEFRPLKMRLDTRRIILGWHHEATLGYHEDTPHPVADCITLFLEGGLSVTVLDPEWVKADEADGEKRPVAPNENDGQEVPTGRAGQGLGSEGEAGADGGVGGDDPPAA